MALYREYVLRLSIIMVHGMTSVVLIGTIGLLPSYIWLRATEKESFLKKQTIADNAVADPSLNQFLADATVKMKGLEAVSGISYRVMIDHLVDAKGPGIKLNDIQFGNQNGHTSLSLSGVSADRESLVAFSKALEKQPEYSSVKVPVSNFIKDRNIEFSLDIQGK